MSLVKVSEFKEKIVKIFMSCGVPEAESKMMSDVLTDAEVKGIKTHGYFRVPRYVSCLKSGGIIADPEFKILVDTPNMALVDGCGGLGIPISVKAAKLAIKKARENGVGIVSVRGSHHLGPAGYYADMCANEGMLGMSMSNGDVLLAATGSREKTIGNNPFAYAIPAGKYGNILYDVAISMGSDIKVIQAAKENKLLPDGWIINSEGIPSNDPNDYINGGTLLPFGSYKGYGLAVMVECFAAALSGSAMTKNVHAWNFQAGTCGNVGHFFMAIDISVFGNKDEYISRVENMIEEIASSAKSQGTDKIYYPGEKEKSLKEKCLREDLVEVDDDTLAQISAIENEIK